MRQLVIPNRITQRDYLSLDKYFSEIDKIGLISGSEEVLLVRRIREGDKAALDRLTTTNLRFVVSVAKQYQNKGLSLGDLINEGNMGLIIAAKRYDETRGFRFISYAVWWIRQAIVGAIAEHARTVRLPYNQLGLLGKIYKTESKFEQEFGRKPTDDELAECMELSVKKVRSARIKPGGSQSIDTPFQSNSEHTLLDVLQCDEFSTDSEVQKQAVVTEIYHSFKVLCKRDRELLAMYFGLGSCPQLSLEEIGEQLNITKEHVGRLKEKALTKLRNCSNAQVLMSCLTKA